jgi:hypothetical protein
MADPVVAAYIEAFSDSYVREICKNIDGVVDGQSFPQDDVYSASKLSMNSTSFWDKYPPLISVTAEEAFYEGNVVGCFMGGGGIGLIPRSFTTGAVRLIAKKTEYMPSEFSDICNLIRYYLVVTHKMPSLLRTRVVIRLFDLLNRNLWLCRNVPSFAHVVLRKLKEFERDSQFITEHGHKFGEPRFSRQLKRYVKNNRNFITKMQGQCRPITHSSMDNYI